MLRPYVIGRAAIRAKMVTHLRATNPIVYQ